MVCVLLEKLRLILNDEEFVVVRDTTRELMDAVHYIQLPHQARSVHKASLSSNGCPMIWEDDATL